MSMRSQRLTASIELQQLLEFSGGLETTLQPRCPPNVELDDESKRLLVLQY